ncbi:MAG: MlaD family protein [Planctomycetota bacterium]
MKETTRNMMVGIFVLSSLTILGILMIWFGETPRWIQRGEWPLKIIGINEIRGIEEGSPVSMSGVEIGRVSSLTFEKSTHPGRGVIINTRIRTRYSVPQGSVARIYGAMLGLGTGEINIIVPAVETPPFDKSGTALITGQMASVVREVLSEDFFASFIRTIDHFGNFAQAAKPAAENLSKLLEQRTVTSVDEPGAADRGMTPNLSTAVERLDRLVAHANEVLGDPQVKDNLKSVAGDLRQASGDLRKTVELWQTETRKLSDNLNSGIIRTDDGIQNVLGKLVSVADRLDGTAKNLHEASNQVADGSGTIGRLVKDPRLYEAAVLTFERLSEFVSTINRIAGKIEEDGYITLGQKTIVGTPTKNFPVGDRTTAPKE